MSKKQRARYHVRKRIFLNRDPERAAFVIGIVQDTRAIPDADEDGWKWGKIELTLGDCYRRVSFEFNMDTKEERSNTLYKIRRIAEIVNAVRDALEIEAESIDSRRGTPKPKVKAKTAAAAG
ncbi:MAG TPA: hypothetical protein VK400_09255 [Pyrinomonadaceae bacterium]|nr:hypothetical protein [Pyrinomonadaceae bacterium]